MKHVGRCWKPLQNVPGDVEELARVLHTGETPLFARQRRTKRLAPDVF